MLVTKRWGVLAWLLLVNTASAAVAERPIAGGLGVSLAKPLPVEVQGAEVAAVDHTTLPDNLELEIPPLPPGSQQPWRYLTQAQLPRPLRERPANAYVMLNDKQLVMRVLAVSETQGCKDFEWLKNTLEKKYDVNGDSEITPPKGYQRALRVTLLKKQIDVRCGPDTVLDYLDVSLIERWSRQQQVAFAAFEREQAEVAQRRLVLERRRAIAYADVFTLGDQYRLDGAFGILFQNPFAKNSTQKFPVDEPFYAVLPNLPEPFDQGEISIVISPDKHPIVIRGQFEGLEFDTIADALKAKYGQPMKSSPRHIIHKVNGNHAIVKKLDENTLEMAFIDTTEQAEQRRRLWAKESEGL